MTGNNSSKNRSGIPRGTPKTERRSLPFVVHGRVGSSVQELRACSKIGISAVDAAARYAPGREATGIRTTQARDFARPSQPRRTEEANASALHTPET